MTFFSRISNYDASKNGDVEQWRRGNGGVGSYGNRSCRDFVDPPPRFRWKEPSTIRQLTGAESYRSIALDKSTHASRIRKSNPPLATSCLRITEVTSQRRWLKYWKGKCKDWTSGGCDKIISFQIPTWSLCLAPRLLGLVVNGRCGSKGSRTSEERSFWPFVPSPKFTNSKKLRN